MRSMAFVLVAILAGATVGFGFGSESLQNLFEDRLPDNLRSGTTVTETITRTEPENITQQPITISSRTTTLIITETVMKTARSHTAVTTTVPTTVTLRIINTTTVSNRITVTSTIDQREGETKEPDEVRDSFYNSWDSLPECTDKTMLSVSPLAEEDYDMILPLGNLNPPGHTLPTDHIYYVLTGHDIGRTAEAEVRAPGDIRRLRIEYTEYFEDAAKYFTDYSITFAPCRNQLLKFGHISLLNPLLADAITRSKPEFCSEYGLSPTTYKHCSTAVELNVDAGTVLGTAGGIMQKSIALDLWAFDLNTPPLAYANPDRYMTQPQNLQLHVVCPLDLFTEDLRVLQANRLGGFGGEGKDGELACGGVMQDVPGTAQGKWFTGQESGVPDSWDRHLALVHSNFDPTVAAISIGGTVMESGVWYFIAEAEGTVNRDFSEVCPGGPIYCYDGAESSFGDPYPGRLFIQLVTETEMFIEHSAGTCGSDMDFVDPVTYTR
jgi:hypothetical protein